MREHILRRLAAAPEPSEPRGDHDLSPDLSPPDAPTPAAVLLPLIEHAGGLTLVFTERTDHLPDHPGQVAFPGGRAEPGDRDPAATALRETHEEVGLAPERIAAMGFGEHHPVAPNKPNKKGNRLNRRVEIWIVPSGKFLTGMSAKSPQK